VSSRVYPTDNVLTYMNMLHKREL